MTDAVVELDLMDRRLLEALQRDGRLSLGELSERVALSPSQCQRRVRRLEEAGIIAGYAAILDPVRSGLGVRALVGVSLQPHGDVSARRFAEAVGAMPEVTQCWMVTGESDYQLQVEATDLKAYSRFLMERLMRVPGVTNVRSAIVLEEVKSTTALPLDHLGGERRRSGPRGRR